MTKKTRSARTEPAQGEGPGIADWGPAMKPEPEHRVLIITIDCENEAMRRPSCVSAALVDIGLAVRNGRTGAIIRDANGNRVGDWSIRRGFELAQLDDEGGDEDERGMLP